MNNLLLKENHTKYINLKVLWAKWINTVNKILINNKGQPFVCNIHIK